MTTEFLTLADTLTLHQLQLDSYGGASGIRDIGLLESALSQPQATFDGNFLHNGLFMMAAAYLFHIVMNHPFVDGNKRVGLLTALVFLDLNGLPIATGSEELYELTMGVAKGQIDKATIARELERIFDATE